MMTFKRADRVADMVKAELSSILLKQTADPRLKSVIVTDVKMSDDLRLARIFFTPLGKSVSKEEAQTGFQKAQGFFKRELGKKLKLRYLPEMVFVFDASFEYGDKIDRLLAELHKGNTEDFG